MDVNHDFKRDILGDDYDPARPVRNWLQYRLVAKRTGQDCDSIALAEELADVKSRGNDASADTMNSFWTTYARALKLETGETFYAKPHTEELLRRHDAEGYREINEMFSEFAVLTHTRGNFVLVPMYLPTGGQRRRSLNPVRGGYRSKWRDYWDLTLASIRAWRAQRVLRRQLDDQFNIPKLGGFDGYVRRHHLGAYVDSQGEVLPLWDGHLDEGAPALPETMAQIEQFLANVTRAITQRAVELQQHASVSASH